MNYDHISEHFNNINKKRQNAQTLENMNELIKIMRERDEKIKSLEEQNDKLINLFNSMRKQIPIILQTIINDMVDSSLSKHLTDIDSDNDEDNEFSKISNIIEEFDKIVSGRKK